MLFGPGPLISLARSDGRCSRTRSRVSVPLRAALLRWSCSVSRQRKRPKIIPDVYEEFLDATSSQFIGLRVERLEHPVPKRLLIESFSAGGGANEVALTIEEETTRVIIRSAAFEADLAALGREVLDYYGQLRVDAQTNRRTLRHIDGLSVRWVTGQ